MKTAATPGRRSSCPRTPSSAPTSPSPTAASTAPTGCWSPTAGTSSCGTGRIRTRSWKRPPAPLPYALAGASYQTTLEGDEYLLLSGRLSIDVYADGYVVIPLRAARRGAGPGGTRRQSRAAAAARLQRPRTAPTLRPRADTPFDRSRRSTGRGAAQRRLVLYVEGKGRHTLQIEVRVRLTRQGGWRVAEATLPAAPASTLAIKVPGRADGSPPQPGPRSPQL